MAQKWMRRMRVPPAVLAAVLGLALGAAAAPTPSAVVHVRLNHQHWTTVQLPATPLGIVAHGKDLWAVGWDQMVAESSDGGRTWTIRHFQKHGELLFTLVFAGGGRVYAFGSVDDTLVSKDGGKRWAQKAWPPIAVAHASLGGNWLLIAGAHKFGFARIKRSGAFSHLNREEASGHRLTWAVASLAPRRAAVIFSRLASGSGPAKGAHKAAAPGWRVLTTADGGKHWRPLMLAGLRETSVAAAGGKYWVRAVPMIGSGPAEILSSAGGGKWLVLTGVVAGSSCNAQGCAGRGAFEPYAAMQPGKPPMGLAYRPGLGVGGPPGRWAAADDAICAVGARRLQCVGATRADLMGILDPAARSHSAPPTPDQAAARTRCLLCFPPLYPQSAQSTGVGGTVLFRAFINRAGRIQWLELLAAPDRALAQAAIDAILKWRYAPTLVNGKAVGVDTQIQVHYVANP